MPAKPKKTIQRRVTNGALSNEQRNELKMKDFLGLLSPGEVEIARKHGLLRWDLWQKCKKINHFGVVFNADGSIEYANGKDHYNVFSCEEYYKIVEKH